MGVYHTKYSNIFLFPKTTALVLLIKSILTSSSSLSPSDVSGLVSVGVHQISLSVRGTRITRTSVMESLRRIYGFTFADKIRNSSIRIEMNVKLSEEKVQRLKTNWVKDLPE